MGTPKVAGWALKVSTQRVKARRSALISELVLAQSSHQSSMAELKEHGS